MLVLIFNQVRWNWKKIRAKIKLQRIPLCKQCKNISLQMQISKNDI